MSWMCNASQSDPMLRFVSLSRLKTVFRPEVAKNLCLAARGFFASLKMTVSGDQLILVTPETYLSATVKSTCA